MDRLEFERRYPRLTKLGTGMVDCWSGIRSLKNHATPAMLERIEDAIRERDFYYDAMENARPERILELEIIVRMQDVDRANLKVSFDSAIVEIRNLEHQLEHKDAYCKTIEKKLASLAQRTNDNTCRRYSDALLGIATILDSVPIPTIKESPESVRKKTIE